MQLPFTGRASELEHIDNLIRDKQGALFAVTGNAGMGKSTLLTQIATIHKDKGQVFIDINDVPPIQTAVEFLQYFAKHAQGLKQTKIALTKINGTYKTTTDLIAPYQSLLQDTVKLGFDEQSEKLELTTDETGKLTTLVKSSLQLLGIWSKSSQEKAKATLGDPELFLLKALQQDCKNQPLIFIDTYERLQAAQTLSQQKISSLYSKPHERLTPVEAKLSLQDWLERLLPFLKQSGAIIVLAGRKTGCWQGQSLERFNDEDIANVVGNSDYADLQALLVEEQTQQTLLTVLKHLSFDGIPLWLQLAINFVSLELMNGRTLEQLATMKNIDELFATLESGNDLSSANIDNASCKLALFQRVMQHNLELANEAWKMALPRRLNKQVLQILFAEQTDSMCDAFTRAGLLPSVRWLDDTTVMLHEEIRDLLLAYAKYKKWLESEQTKALHKQLAETSAQRYQQTANIQFLLERLYHSLMSEETSDLELIKDPKLLFEMAVDLETEKQYVKMSQVLLRLIDIQPNHEDAWYGLGIALSQQGKLAEAEAAYRKQTDIKPDHNDAWYGLGYALSQLGKHAEAETAYRKQINIKPDYEKAWNNLGIAYWKQGKPEQAQLTYARALEINPQDLLALSNDAELALVQNDKARCLQRLASLSALVDNKSDIYIILPFLAWLAEPESPLDAIYQAITQFDSSVKIDWDSTDTEPVILHLTPEQQSVARQFIAYFQGTGELPPKSSN